MLKMTKIRNIQNYKCYYWINFFSDMCKFPKFIGDQIILNYNIPGSINRNMFDLCSHDFVTLATTFICVYCLFK